MKWRMTMVAMRPLLLAEIVSIVRNWTAGDLGTISGWVGSIVSQLAQHPELQQELGSRMADLASEDAAFLDAAIDEMLRIDNPFLSNGRKTTRATGLGGTLYRAGSPGLSGLGVSKQGLCRFWRPGRLWSSRKCRQQPHL